MSYKDEVTDDLAERRRVKQQLSEPNTGRCGGYSVVYNPEDQTVGLVFDVGDNEVTFVFPRDVARRLGKRVEIAAERARRGGPG